MPCHRRDAYPPRSSKQLGDLCLDRKGQSVLTKPRNMLRQEQGRCSERTKVEITSPRRYLTERDVLAACPKSASFSLRLLLWKQRSHSSWKMAHSAELLFFRLLLIRSRPFWKTNAKPGTDLRHDVLTLTQRYHKFELTPRCGVWIGRLQRSVSS